MSVSECVTTLGVIMTVLLPVAIWSLIAMEHRLNWELIDYCTNIGIWIVFLVGFYAGYCCRKSWGNWLMFYSLAGGMVIMLIISLLF